MRCIAERTQTDLYVNVFARAYAALSVLFSLSRFLCCRSIVSVCVSFDTRTARCAKGWWVRLDWVQIFLVCICLHNVLSSSCTLYVLEGSRTREYLLYASVCANAIPFLKFILE